VQIGKYTVNIGQGQDIRIGDQTIYQGADAETIREVFRTVLQEMQISDQPPATPPPVSPEDQKEAVCQFLQDIEDNFKHIKLFHTQQPIVLKEQYISIQVTLERKYKHEVETTWAYAEDETELKRVYALKKVDEETRQTQVDWEAAKKQHQKIMVLADPGMGKSTLLRIEAGATAHTERQELLDKEITLEDVVFPLFLRLSSLDEQADEIFEAIPKLIKRDYPKTYLGIEHLLNEKLSNGKCILLLDALDEVSKGRRIDLAEKLNRFARNYACPIVVALGQVQPKVLQKLQRSLNEKNPSVKQQNLDRELHLGWKAAQALGKIGSLEAVQILTPALWHEDGHTWRGAAEALEKIGSPQAFKALISAINQGDSFVGRRARRALAKLDSPQQAFEGLILAFNHSDSNVRFQAARALGQMGNTEAVETLISALNHSDSNVRFQAATVLGEIGNPQAVNALISAFNHSDSNVRFQAATVLGQMGNTEAVEALIATLNDSDNNLRVQAARALGQIGNAETLAKLIKSFEIDIYDDDIFPLARTLAVRFSKEKLPFIPVYPERVRFRFSSILATVKRRWREVIQKTRDMRSTG
jgi:HEAT repeat protein